MDQRSITGWVAVSGAPLIVPDVSQDARYVDVAGTDTRSELAVPLKTEEKVIGVLNIESDRRDAFDESDLAVLQSLADQAAVAIEKARLFRAEQRRAEQFRVISEVGRRITSILDIDELLEQMVRLIRQAFNYYHVGIGLIEGDDVVYKVGAGPLWDDPGFQFKPARLKVGREGITGWVAATGLPLRVPDVSQEPRYVLMQGSRTRSELAVAVTAKGEVLGVLDVQSDRLGAFDATDVTVFQSLADQAGVAIQNARLYEDEQRRAEQFRVIGELGRHITSILPVDELLERVVRLIQEAFSYYAVGIGLVEGDEVVFKAGAGAFWDASQLYRTLRLQVGRQGFTGWVAQTGEPLLVNDVSQDPRYYYTPQAGETRSEMTVPLKIKGAVIGVLGAQSDRLNAFDASDLAVLQSLGHQAAVAIENARLYERAKELAVLEERQRLSRELHDAVTQTLFSASLIGEVLPRLWERDPDEARQRLEDLRKMTRGALAEMRTLLLELRPAVLAETELSDLLRQLAEAITGRTRVPVMVAVEGQCSLPPDVKVALYRIAQEALNNMAKHAGAGRATIGLRCVEIAEEQEKGVELRVSDDGRGFDPAGVSSDHLGLGIMHERAEAVGATLMIDSAIGRGTQITVVWTGKGGA
jgi:GAF domain-containing protein